MATGWWETLVGGTRVYHPAPGESATSAGPTSTQPTAASQAPLGGTYQQPYNPTPTSSPSGSASSPLDPYAYAYNPNTASTSSYNTSPQSMASLYETVAGPNGAQTQSTG